jgi:transposase
MWQPYLDVIREKCSQALHILDRFHIVAKMNKALDEVRAAEAREMARAGHEPLLKKTRWCVLKRKDNLHSPAEIPAARPAPLQPQNRPRLPAQGGFPAVLEV